jgi:pilus assembly protein CpaD
MASNLTNTKFRGAMALRAFAVVCLATSLAGCYTYGTPEGAYASDYRLRHPITLREREHTVEIFLGRNRGGLTASERADVLSFAQIWRHEATSGIVVEIPRSRAINQAAAESVREVRAILAASGVPRNAVVVRGYSLPSVSLASIRLRYSKIAAQAGPCGLWPNDLGPSYDPGLTYLENRPYWNFGCASQRNLAAMVDNPADLVQPRGETPAYTPRRSVVIDKYRKGDSPSGKYDGYEAGKISDLK